MFLPMIYDKRLLHMNLPQLVSQIRGCIKMLDETPSLDHLDRLYCLFMSEYPIISLLLINYQNTTRCTASNCGYEKELTWLPTYCSPLKCEREIAGKLHTESSRVLSNLTRLQIDRNGYILSAKEFLFKPIQSSKTKPSTTNATFIFRWWKTEN